jgi:hypothetical protein
MQFRGTHVRHLSIIGFPSESPAPLRYTLQKSTMQQLLRKPAIITNDAMIHHDAQASRRQLLRMPTATCVAMIMDPQQT